MKVNVIFKNIKLLLIFCFLSFSVNATLIKTDHNSFIDDSSSLEWMNFGVNNGLSFNRVKELLDDNQIYSGWRLANQREVTSLWLNTFSHLDTGTKNLNQYGQGFGRTDQVNDNFGHSVLENVFDIMGYNSLIGANEYALGWFEGDDGHLKYFHLYNSVSNSANDKAMVNGEFANFDSWRSRSSGFYSTMLVKNHQISVARMSVPEPPTLTLFILVFLFLNYRILKNSITK